MRKEMITWLQDFHLRFANESGAKVVMLSNSDGYFYDEKGIGDEKAAGTHMMFTRLFYFKHDQTSEEGVIFPVL